MCFTTGMVFPHLSYVLKWPSSPEGQVCCPMKEQEAFKQLSFLSCFPVRWKHTNTTLPINTKIKYWLTWRLSFSKLCKVSLNFSLGEDNGSWMNLLKVLIVSLNRTKIDGIICNNKTRTSLAGRYMFSTENLNCHIYKVWIFKIQTYWNDL